MTNKELSQIANMELRDQLEAKEQMIKELKERIDKSCNKLHAIEMLLRYHNNICASSIENVELYLKTGLQLQFGFLKANEEA